MRELTCNDYGLFHFMNYFTRVNLEKRTLFKYICPVFYRSIKAIDLFLC